MNIFHPGARNKRKDLQASIHLSGHLLWCQTAAACTKYLLFLKQSAHTLTSHWTVFAMPNTFFFFFLIPADHEPWACFAFFFKYNLTKRSIHLSSRQQNAHNTAFPWTVLCDQNRYIQKITSIKFKSTNNLPHSHLEVCRDMQGQVRPLNKFPNEIYFIPCHSEYVCILPWGMFIAIIGISWIPISLSSTIRGYWQTESSVRLKSQKGVGGGCPGKVMAIKLNACRYAGNGYS